MSNIIYRVNGIEIDNKLFDYYKDLVIKKGNIKESVNFKNNTESDIISYAKYEVFKRAVLLDLAQKNEVKITEKELEEKLYRITLEYADINEFREAISNLTIGYNRYLKLIAEDLKIEKYLRKNFNPTDYSVDISDVIDYYDRNKETYSSIEIVKISHILKKVNEDDKEEMHTLFDSLVEIKYMDKDFEELAEIFSDCPSKENGGNLGYIKRGMMPVDFETVAFRLEKDEVSSVVKTSMGLHLIKCTDKLSGFDAVKNDIEYFLINDKMLNDIEVFVQEKLASAEIEEK